MFTLIPDHTRSWFGCYVVTMVRVDSLQEHCGGREKIIGIRYSHEIKEKVYYLSRQKDVIGSHSGYF